MLRMLSDNTTKFVSQACLLSFHIYLYLSIDLCTCVSHLSMVSCGQKSQLNVCSTACFMVLSGKQVTDQVENSFLAGQNVKMFHSSKKCFMLNVNIRKSSSPSSMPWPRWSSGCTNGCFSHHLSLLNPILSWMHKRMLQSPPFSIESCPELNAQTDASVTTFLCWILSWVECTNGCFSHHLSLFNPILSWMHKRILQSPPFCIESYPELNAQTDASVTTFLYWILSWVECTNGCFSHHLSLFNPILSWMHKQMLQSPPFSIESCLGLNAQTDATVTTFLYWILSWVECTNRCFSHHLSLLNPVLSWMLKQMLQSPPFSIESYPELNAQTDASVTTFLYWILSWVECTNGCFSHHLSLLNPILSWMHKRMLQSPPFSI